MNNLRDEKVNFRLLIRTAPERVYDALATGQGLDEWFTTGAEVDARPGGSIHFCWRDWGLDHYNGDYSGPVLEANRPSRFAFQWPADSLTYNTTVEFDFEKVEAGTVLHVVETGYENTKAGMQDLLNRVSGWAHVLTMMKYYLEHGVQY